MSHRCRPNEANNFSKNFRGHYPLDETSTWIAKMQRISAGSKLNNAGLKQYFKSQGGSKNPYDLYDEHMGGPNVFTERQLQ